MAVNSASLTTLANLKAALTIATADTSKDTLLEQCIDRASQWIEGRTERKLKARKYNGGASTHATTGVTDEDYIFFSGSTSQVPSLAPRGRKQLELVQRLDDIR